MSFIADAVGALELLTSDAPGLLGLVLGPQWGIFQGGAPIVVADTVLTVGYKQSWALSDYPVEEGAFETYDKVQIPYDARFRFASGGSAIDRQALLDSIAAIAGDLNLYDVVTPEAVYINANITNYEYQRRATNGLGLLTVDVWALEVRVATSAPGSLSNAASPNDAPQTNGGTVQPTAPSAAQSSLGGMPASLGGFA